MYLTNYVQPVYILFQLNPTGTYKHSLDQCNHRVYIANLLDSFLKEKKQHLFTIVVEDIT